MKYEVTIEEKIIYKIVVEAEDDRPAIEKAYCLFEDSPEKFERVDSDYWFTELEEV